MAATLIDPNKPQQAAGPAAPVSSPGGATVIDPNKPAPALAPNVPGGQSGGATVIDPNAGSVAGTGSWDDFNTVLTNESMMHSLPGLRTQAQAARERLGPNWAGAADAAGSIASPSSLAYLIPRIGPEIAGGLHEGVKSYMDQPDWWPDAAGRGQIEKDAAAGAATAGVGHLAGLNASKLLPKAVEWGVPALSGGAAQHALQNLLGGTGYDFAAGLGVTAALAKPSQWVARGLEKIGEQPAVQRTINLLAQGGGSAVRNSSPGPLWDQWMTGQ